MFGFYYLNILILFLVRGLNSFANARQTANFFNV